MVARKYTFLYGIQGELWSKKYDEHHVCRCKSFYYKQLRNKNIREYENIDSNQNQIIYKTTKQHEI